LNGLNIQDGLSAFLADLAVNILYELELLDSSGRTCFAKRKRTASHSFELAKAVMACSSAAESLELTKE